MKGDRGRGTLEKEKPPIFGMIQRSGEVVIRMLANVQQATIEPILRATIALGTIVYTDEYDMGTQATPKPLVRRTLQRLCGGTLLRSARSRGSSKGSATTQEA